MRKATRRSGFASVRAIDQPPWAISHLAAQYSGRNYVLRCDARVTALVSSVKGQIGRDIRHVNYRQVSRIRYSPCRLNNPQHRIA